MNLKKLFHPKYLPHFALVCGALCALVRWWLFTSVDSKGLLDSQHPGHWLTWLITAVAMAGLALGTWNLRQAPKYSFNFPASTLSAVGRWVAAAVILLSSVANLISKTDMLTKLTALLGLGSAAALGFLGLCRKEGKRPSMLLHTLICVHLMLQLVCMYRLWSANSQVQTYCFSLLSIVSVMLSVYYCAAFDSKAGDRRAHALTHLAAVYFSISALPHCSDPLFFIAMAVWMVTDLCCLIPMPRGEHA